MSPKKRVRGEASLRVLKRAGIWTVALVLALAGCSHKVPTSSQTEDTANTTAQVAGKQVAPSPTPTPTKGAVAATSKRSGAVGPSPLALPWTPDPSVRIEPSIAPACLHPGVVVTITVQTEPKAALAYVAMYSNNKSGADHPFGEGYGGNDKGKADASGHFTSTFILQPNAPAGPGRVDVIVGWNGRWGHAGVPFSVAGPSGACS